MNYHNIKHCDMLNGEGLRVVLFVSGCDRHCPGCQNPQTWDKNSGITFGPEEVAEIFGDLAEDYCTGLTLVGGEPLMPYNRDELTNLCQSVKEKFPNKTIWCYTGFRFEEVKDLPIMKYIDVLLDGPFVQELLDEKTHWVGSSNQRVIDVKKSLEADDIILYC